MTSDVPGSALDPDPDRPFDPVLPPGGPSRKARVARGLVRAATAWPWGRFLRASADPGGATERRLRQILRRNRDTVFGREHDFRSIRTLEDYARAVPVRDYTGHEPWIRRMVDGEPGVLLADEPFYYAQSSGTTGTPKFIPVTRRSLEDFKFGRTLYMRVLAENLPQIVEGGEIAVTSPKVLGRTAKGIPYGSITGAFEDEKPGWMKRIDTYPVALFELDDFDLKYYLILRIALENRITRIASPNPSTVMLLATKLQEFSDRLLADLEGGTVDGLEGLDPDLQAEIRRRVHGPNPERARRLRELRGRGDVIRLPDLWPEMAAVLCWQGGSAPFYLRQFPRYFGEGFPVHEMGFVATEGCFSVPFSPRRADGALALPGVVAEFVPEEERDAGRLDGAVDPSRVEVGGSYYILITTAGGLYRYDINDLVEITGRFRQTPMLRFLHKGGTMISITGEKLGESHVVEALAAVQERLAIRPRGFTVSVDLAGERPRYLFYVEAPGLEGAAGLGGLLRACDEQLAVANLEYEAKRTSLRIAPPELIVVADGSYEAHRRARVSTGAPDAHIKPLHLAPDRSVPDSFEVVATVPWPGDPASS